MRRRTRLRWELFSIVVTGGRNQRYLNGRWIRPYLAALPQRLRRQAALRLLSRSRHYFNWFALGVSGRTRGAALEAEYERNRSSREAIFRQILGPKLRPKMTVLDFGCGPGFLAHLVSREVGRVIGVDVSRGAIACAAVLHSRRNVDFVLVEPGNLSPVADQRVDLIYSFAVLYHLNDQQLTATLCEFERVLKPGGTGVVHFAVPGRDGDDAGSAPGRRSGPLAAFRPWYRPRPAAVLTREMRLAGLTVEEIIPIAELWTIPDEIGGEHLLIFSRPPATAAT